MALPGVREEQDVVVRARGEQVLDEVLVVGLGPDDALAAPLLGAVVGDARSLDESKVRHRDDAALVRDHVLHAEFAGGRDDLGPARRGVLGLYLEELALDEREKLGLRFQDAAQLLYQLHEPQVLLLDLAALKAGQLVQAQLEDGVRLLRRERVFRHQPDLRLVAIGRAADDLHEVVQVIERDDIALEDVGAFLSLLQLELRAAGDDLAHGGEVVDAFDGSTR